MLRDAIASALGQKSVTLEVIAIVDGSTDDTTDFLRGLSDPRVRFIRNEQPRGVSVARNQGITAARGEWVAFLDDDDVWAPEKLALQLSAAAHDPASVIGYTGSVYIDAAGAVIEHRRTPEPRELVRGLIRTNLIGGPSSVIARASTLQDVGGFDPRFSTLADWDLWLRLCERGVAFVSPQVLVGYRIHDTNMHTAGVAGLRRELRDLRRKHKDLAKSHSERVGGAEFSLWLVRRYRESDRRIDAAREYVALAVAQRRIRHLARAGIMLAGPRFRRTRVAPPSSQLEKSYPWLPAAESCR